MNYSVTQLTGTGDDTLLPPGESRPLPWLVPGARVRLRAGSLKGLEGTLVGQRGDRLLIALATSSPAHVEVGRQNIEVAKVSPHELLQAASSCQPG